MQLFTDQYYHIYNRSVNHEPLYRSHDNYIYFLDKLDALRSAWNVLAYCLMPTHFHLLVQILTKDQNALRRKFGDILSGYARAINRQTGRTGSLFQQHSKAKLVKNEQQLLMLLHYIHQNPVRAGLVTGQHEWEYSSYRDYIGIKTGMSVTTQEVISCYGSMENFVDESKNVVMTEQL